MAFQYHLRMQSLKLSFRQLPENRHLFPSLNNNLHYNLTIKNHIQLPKRLIDRPQKAQTLLNDMSPKQNIKVWLC